MKNLTTTKTTTKQQTPVIGTGETNALPVAKWGENEQCARKTRVAQIKRALAT